jgi:hypothetical protein
MPVLTILIGASGSAKPAAEYSECLQSSQMARLHRTFNGGSGDRVHASPLNSAEVVQEKQSRQKHNQWNPEMDVMQDCA